MTISHADIGQNNESRIGVSKEGPCHVIVHLVSADDPDTWIPPDGPSVFPPRHIEKVIRQRYAHRPSDPHHAAPVIKRTVPSELQIRKDFFQIQNPKNAHHASCGVLDFFRNRKLETTLAQTDAEFGRKFNKGFYQIKQMYNPEVYEAMADFISPMENYEFFSAFERFLAVIHNSHLVVRLSPQEDAVEIWSKRFAVLMRELGETRPTSFHTIVVPMVLKPITPDIACHFIGKEWNKTSCVSSLVPPLSVYARTVNRWILPLTEPFVEDQNGHLIKPQTKLLRLDVGYLFGQRRKFGRMNAVMDTEIKKRFPEGNNRFVYKIFHKDSSLHKEHSVQQTVSQGKSSIKDTTSTDNEKIRNTIGGQRGSIRSTGHLGQSALTIRGKKITVEKLLKTNNKRAPRNRLYWVHYVDLRRHHLPSVFAKMVPVSNANDPTHGSGPTEDFFDAFYPISRREKYREPKKTNQLLHPQFDAHVIRNMIASEIQNSMAKATTTLKTCDNRLRDIKKEHADRVHRLETGIAGLGNMPETSIPVSNNGVKTDVLRGLKHFKSQCRDKYLKLLSGDVTATYQDNGTVNYQQPNATQRQIVGNDDLVALQKWQMLSNELANDEHPYAKPKFTIDAPLITISECTEAVENANPQNVLIRPESDPMEAHCIFLRLVIDSGCQHFYFEIDDGWNEEDDFTLPAHLNDQKSSSKNVGSKRRQSSVMVENLGRPGFDFLDKDGLQKVTGLYTRLKRKHDDAPKKSKDLQERFEFHSDIPVKSQPFQTETGKTIIVPPDVSYVQLEEREQPSEKRVTADTSDDLQDINVTEVGKVPPANDFPQHLPLPATDEKVRSNIENSGT